MHKGEEFNSEKGTAVIWPQRKQTHLQKKKCFQSNNTKINGRQNKRQSDGSGIRSVVENKTLENGTIILKEITKPIFKQ